MNYLQQMEKEEEEQFRKARNYLMDNYMRSFTVDMLAKETGVERRLISKWVREGRLLKGREARTNDDFINELIKSKDKKNK